MKKFGIYPLILITLLTSTTISCVKDAEIGLDVDGNLPQCEVLMKFAVASQTNPDGTEILPLDISSRADTPSLSEQAVNNVWVFQFGAEALDDNTPMIGLPRYANITDGEQVAINLALAESQKNTLIFVANVGDSFQWDLSAGDTYDKLAAKLITIQKESDVSGDGLSMSGKYVGLIDEQAEISPVLYRNAAKIELKLKPAPQFEIVSVQLRNVSAKLSPIEGFNALTSGSASPVPTINYDAVDYANGADIEGGKSFVFYTPANLQGATQTNNDESKKNKFAPESATYFYIILKDKDSDDDYSYFLSIYPGADNTKDFNIASNTHYVYTLDINNLDDIDLDSRVETDAPITLEIANSYIINPITNDYPYEKRSILVPIKRVNDYWGQNLAGYGNTPANMIGATDTWTAELLWQDKSSMVSKSVSTITIGRNAVEIAQGKSSGVGSDGGFVINIPKNMLASNYGNFVVAVRKVADGDILWSWHFWVTDYNPDQKINIDPETFQYSVKAGEVHRYRGAMWGYNSAPDYTYSNAVTAQTPYAQSVIMDRNIGVIDNTSYGSGNYGQGKLYYQFGRKDPLPGNIDLYNIDGVKLETSLWDKATANNVARQAASLAEAVHNPLTSYSMKGNFDWSDDAAISGNNTVLWFDPAAPVTDAATAKSIYDPCPAGWKLPINGTWSDFNNSNAIGDAEAKLVAYSDYAKFYLDGYRRYDNLCKLSDGGARVFIRTATCMDTYRAYVMILRVASGTTTITPSSAYNTASGYSVRCVSEQYN